MCFGSQKLYMFRESRWFMLKNEREEIKVRYDERKKFQYKSQVVIVYIV